MEPLLIILDEIDKFIRKLEEPFERKWEEDEKTLREGLRCLSQELTQIETQLEQLKAIHGRK